MINMKTGKRILLRTFGCVLLMTIIFYGCDEKVEHRKCWLNVRNGSGWSSGGSVVECDSFQMYGTRKASAWVDGVKMDIVADDVIYPGVR